MTKRKEKNEKPEIPDSLTKSQQDQLLCLITKYNCVFQQKNKALKGTELIQHEIHTDSRPIRQPYRRQNPQVRIQEQ